MLSHIAKCAHFTMKCSGITFSFNWCQTILTTAAANGFYLSGAKENWNTATVELELRKNRTHALMWPIFAQHTQSKSPKMRHK